MLGIENLKSLVLDIVGFGESIVEKLNDGKLSIGEALSVTVDIVPTVFSTVKNWTSIRDQYRDLSEEERNEIKEAVKQEFDLDNEYAEAKIEAGFEVAIAVEKFFSIKKAA